MAELVGMIMKEGKGVKEIPGRNNTQKEDKDLGGEYFPVPLGMWDSNDTRDPADDSKRFGSTGLCAILAYMLWHPKILHCIEYNAPSPKYPEEQLALSPTHRPKSDNPCATTDPLEVLV